MDSPERRLADPLTEIMVRGWNRPQRGQVAALLQQRNRFAGMLKAIVLDPDGNISLITTELGRIDLGGEPALLNTQIETILHLNRTLPKHLRGAHHSSLDLSNPCLLYTSPSPRDYAASRMPSSA